MNHTFATTVALAGLMVGCAATASTSDSDSDSDTTSGSFESLKLPLSLQRNEFDAPLTKASIQGLQTWLDDAAFEVKWESMLSAPIELLGGASSAFHADLAALPAKRLPGGEVLCHGDPKIDNFGWTLVDGVAVFSDNDFDDAGFCPVAAEALRYLLATDLAFADPDLDDAALEAYVDTVADKSAAIDIDPATEPVWADVRSKGLAKDTSGDLIVLGGEVQAATVAEKAAVLALVDEDPRFSVRVRDISRNVRTTGGSAGLRRFWLLSESEDGTRTIIELKELGIPGTEFGRHSDTLDGPDRFDVLQSFWWDTTTANDHFGIDLLGSRWVVRDRLIRTNPKPAKLTTAQRMNMVQAESSLLALKHRKAWHKVKKSDLRSWLRASAATLVDRWRTTYTSAGGN